jgi:hypothetical protein
MKAIWSFRNQHRKVSFRREVKEEFGIQNHTP